MRHAATVFAKARARPDRAGASRSRPPSSAIAAGPHRIRRRPVSARATPTAPSISSSSRRRRRATTLPDELKDGIAVVTDNEMHDPVFPNGCAICEVEIDPDTGALRITRYASVDDVGRCINPLIVHGQTHGGIAQGVGQALWEQCYIEPDSGQPLMRLADGLRHAARRQPAVVQDRDRRGAVADQSARHQGRRRRRHHAGAGGRSSAPSSMRCAATACATSRCRRRRIISGERSRTPKRLRTPRRSRTHQTKKRTPIAPK